MSHKYFILGVALLTSISKIYSQNCEAYQVTKIDSTENYYLITIRKSRINYLIVSSKTRRKPKNQIVVSETYRFKLLESQIISDLPIHDGFPTDIVLEGKNIWSTEDNYRLYSTKNLKGLNLIKKCSCR